MFRTRDEKSRKKEQRIAEGMKRSALEGAAAETVQRYGSANKQHFVAYSGVDNEAGKTLKKGLKSIANSKVNPEYAGQNIKQQAGFSAEVKATARKNADSIINKENKRVSRTDDLGKVNDPFYDLVDVDASGNPIKGTGTQMKFVGRSPDELLDKLNSKKYQKYYDKNVPFMVADDDYDALMGQNGSQGIIDNRIEALKKQAERAEADGRVDVAAEKWEQIDKYENTKKNLRKSGLTRDDAIEARLSPEWSTAKDVAKLSHHAGVEQAKYGAAISGSVSIVKNIVACSKGEKTAEEAALSVAADTGKGAAVSYATAFAGSAIKGAMQNSSSAYLQSIAKTNLASGLVTTSITVGKTLHKYIRGDIDGAECIEELGQNGVGEIGSTIFASVGIAVIPGTAPAFLGVIAGMAGATFGYAAATAIYRELSDTLKEAKLEHEERLRIQAECAEAVRMIKEYRAEMEAMIDKYFLEYKNCFNEAMSTMQVAYQMGDADNVIASANQITRKLGGKVQYETVEEFKTFFDSDSIDEF